MTSTSAGLPRITPAAITLTVGDQVLVAGEIRLGAAPRGATVIVTDGSASTVDTALVMNRVAAHGYESVVVPLSGLTATYATGDRLACVFAAADYLGSRGRNHDNIGLLGIGAGGRVVLDAAAAERFGAAVGISPTDGLSTAAAVQWLQDVPVVRTPWLGLFAGEDGALGAALGNFAGALSQTASAHVQTVTYPHVGSDFYHDSGGTLTHAASFEAWQRVIEWFNLQVAPPVDGIARRGSAVTTSSLPVTAPEK